MGITTEVNCEGFRVLERCPASGSALVNRALHVESGTMVALKRLSPTVVDTDSLEREALLLANLNHPAIASVFEYRSTGDVPVLATYWVPGDSLRAYLDRNGHCTVDDALTVFHQLCEALQSAHDAGIVHGDVSPANLIVDDDLKLTVVDFGVGVHTHGSTVSIGVGESLSGTPRYLAPEVIRGESPSARSDQYASAIVLYELLTGDWPYEGEQSSMATALYQQVHVEPVPLIERLPDINPAISESIDKALEKLPGSRHSCMREFISSLRIEDDVSSLYGTLRAHRLWPLAAAVTLLMWSGPHITGMVSAESDGSSNDCNLMSNADLESDIALSRFYPDEGGTDRTAIVEGKGSDGSKALRVGLENEYGLYGEIVSIEPDRQYRFSIIASAVGNIHEATLRVLWLDVDYKPLNGVTAEMPLDTSQLGRSSIERLSPPNAARFAVPTIYKDASPGVLYADDMRFQAVGETCSPSEPRS